MVSNIIQEGQNQTIRKFASDRCIKHNTHDKHDKTSTFVITVTSLRYIDTEVFPYVTLRHKRKA